ncbi:hypothetical protein BpOF4_21469 (plasmid) [Alkalihalophilus pseudofirmus OF4]|uniref:Uncharacterized protein n=1 Tax=Alkalihalophilus pseudofirmus (strain ATCC BAA-2126 / JCM 17055 / OF4) TaxID=398511 RepID=D3G1R3_ALKPO|nr:hypothetical protein BpOF4_21469 [Alkalihalophilus pseudofirmus OF4]
MILRNKFNVALNKSGTVYKKLNHFAPLDLSRGGFLVKKGLT